MRLLVCGSRNWTRADVVYAALDALRPAIVIEGGATGADAIARQWARDRGAYLDTYPADWNRDGKAAGPIRNARMLAEGRPTHGLALGALWIVVVCGVCGGDDGGRAECRRCGGSGRSGWKRTGTGDMVAKLLAARILVRWVAAPGAEAVGLTSFPEPPL